MNHKALIAHIFEHAIPTNSFLRDMIYLQDEEGVLRTSAKIMANNEEILGHKTQQRPVSNMGGHIDEIRTLLHTYAFWRLAPQEPTTANNILSGVNGIERSITAIRSLVTEHNYVVVIDQTAYENDVIGKGLQGMIEEGSLFLGMGIRVSPSAATYGPNTEKTPWGHGVEEGDIFIKAIAFQRTNAVCYVHLEPHVNTKEDISYVNVRYFCSPLHNYGLHAIV